MVLTRDMSDDRLVPSQASHKALRTTPNASMFPYMLRDTTSKSGQSCNTPPSTLAMPRPHRPGWHEAASLGNSRGMHSPSTVTATSSTAGTVVAAVARRLSLPSLPCCVTRAARLRCSSFSTRSHARAPPVMRFSRRAPSPSEKQIGRASGSTLYPSTLTCTPTFALRSTNSLTTR